MLILYCTLCEIFVHVEHIDMAIIFIKNVKVTWILKYMN